MSQLPTPVRAAVGLAATLLDRLRQIPDDAPDVPVQIVGAAMQLSLRVQQQIAAYVARGDEVLSHIRGTSHDAPSWATFDEPPKDAADKPAEAGPPAPKKVTAPRAAPKPPPPAKVTGPAPNGAKKMAKKSAKKAAKKVPPPGAAEPAAVRSKFDQTPQPKPPSPAAG